VSNLRPCMLHQSVASIYLYFCVFAWAPWSHVPNTLYVPRLYISSRSRLSRKLHLSSFPHINALTNKVQASTWTSPHNIGCERVSLQVFDRIEAAALAPMPGCVYIQAFVLRMSVRVCLCVGVWVWVRMCVYVHVCVFNPGKDTFLNIYFNLYTNVLADQE
jgi:hypothetical protein